MGRETRETRASKGRSMSRLCTSLSIEINMRDLRQRRARAGAGLASSSRKAPRGWSKGMEATQKRCLSGASAGAKDDTSVRKGKTGRGETAGENDADCRKCGQSKQRRRVLWKSVENL